MANKSFPSSCAPLFQNGSKCENELRNGMQFLSRANQSHFHKNGFALRLALTRLVSLLTIYVQVSRET